MQNNSITIESIIFHFLLISFLFALIPAIFIGFQIMAVLFFLIFIIHSKNEIDFDRVDYLLLLFFGLILIKSFFVKDFLTSFISSLLIPFYIIVFFFYKNYPFNPAKLKKIVNFTSYGLIIFNTIILIHYLIIKKDIVLNLFSNKLILQHSMGDKIFSPVISILSHPTGGGIVIAILISIILLWLSKNFKNTTKKEKIIYFLSILLATTTLFFTYSRSGYIIFFLSILFIIINEKKFILLVPFFLLAMIFTIVNPGHKIRSTIINLKNSYNVGPRLVQYEIALKLFKDSPITGIGLMQFKEIYKNSYNTPEYNHYPSYYFDTVDYVHNNYLALLTETGILGFLLFYLFIIFKLKNILKNKKEDNSLKSAGLFIILWFLLDSLFNANLYVAPIGIFLWIFIGISENKKWVS
ncbi:MAG: O-antigen ligase family protein [Brevinematia bacterium]